MKEERGREGGVKEEREAGWDFAITLPVSARRGERNHQGRQGAKGREGMFLASETTLERTKNVENAPRVLIVPVAVTKFLTPLLRLRALVP